MNALSTRIHAQNGRYSSYCFVAQLVCYSWGQIFLALSRWHQYRALHVPMYWQQSCTCKELKFFWQMPPTVMIFCYIRYQIYIDLFTSSCTFEINCNSHFKKMGTTVHLQEGFWACACVLVQPPFVALSPVYDAAYKLFVTIFQTFHTFSCQKRRAYLYEKWWF